MSLWLTVRIVSLIPTYFCKGAYITFTEFGQAYDPNGPEWVVPHRKPNNAPLAPALQLENEEFAQVRGKVEVHLLFNSSYSQFVYY